MSYNPSPATRYADLAALQRFRSAMALSDTQRCHILTIGDSVTEGSNLTTNVRTNRYVDVLRRKLQARTALGYGGPGYVNLPNFPTGNSSTAGAPASWTWSGANNLAGTEDGYMTAGPSMTTDQTATLTMTSATSVDVYGFATGTYKYSIDGGAVQTLTQAAGLTGAGSRRYLGNISLGSRGAHTITFSPPSGSQLFLNGCTVYDGDEGIGIGLWPRGHYGITSTSYASGMTSTVVSQYGKGSSYAGAFTFALATICLGLNDISGSIPAATYGANLTSIVAALKAGNVAAGGYNPSIVLLTPYTRGGYTQAQWAPYVAAAQAVADADPSNVCVLNLNDRWASPGSVGNSHSYGLLDTDDTHPVLAGHRLIGETLDAFLAAR